MRQRLKDSLRPIWAKHVASILKQYGHEQLKNDHAELAQKVDGLRQENAELRRALAKAQNTEVRAFKQLECCVDGCREPRFRAQMCMAHYYEQRMTKVI